MIIRYLPVVAFGVYVHIPYCLQRCTYCDFSTFEVGDPRVGQSDEYISLVHREIQNRHPYVLKHFPLIDTLYFGGGTPSLLAPHHILSIKERLSQVGFSFSKDLEWTIEINPATVSEENLIAYLRMGINRFSVGVQTFHDEQLRNAGRRHNAQQTRETLALLQSHQLNFNMDLLFALPRQTLADLESDIEEFLVWRPKHISPYCLTVPESNPMALNRPHDENQVKMFEMIRSHFLKAGYTQYEISNYALPGSECLHNKIYWQDESYWGLGLSSHSFFQNNTHGVRFWNASQYKNYRESVGQIAQSPHDALPPHQKEVLEFREALTDYCHTALRTDAGLDSTRLAEKFSPAAQNWVETKLSSMKEYVIVEKNKWRLSFQGQVLSNQVFEAICMDEKEYRNLRNFEKVDTPDLPPIFK